MANALITGVSGLNSHQRMLEVIGNNLANLNTTAYKSRRTLFSDMLYETVRAASGGTNGELGGVNPAQVGSGSRVARIDLQFSQGNFETTGGQLDFALEGNGFFIVNDGTQNLYTRAGAFGVEMTSRSAGSGSSILVVAMHPVQRMDNASTQCFFTPSPPFRSPAPWRRRNSRSPGASCRRSA